MGFFGRTRGEATPSPNPYADIAAVLAQASAARDAGLLSEAEYEREQLFFQHSFIARMAERTGNPAPTFVEFLYSTAGYEPPPFTI